MGKSIAEVPFSFRAKEVYVWSSSLIPGGRSVPKPDRATPSLLEGHSRRECGDGCRETRRALIGCQPSANCLGNYIGVKVRSRRVSIVISERSAETLSTSDATVGPLRFPDRADELVIETLMIPLQMIMGDESADTRAEMILSQGNHPTKERPSDFWVSTCSSNVEACGEVDSGDV